MNGKERFAGAILVITLAIGIIAGVFDRHQDADSVLRQACGSPVESGDGGHEIFRKLDLNIASVDELEILPGIGPKKAGAIVDYRERHGGFKYLDQLTEVKGIGDKTLERIAPYVFVSTEVTPACD